MQDKNELSDIVLNKSGASSSSKKTILAVATLGIVLIIVVLLMRPSDSQENTLAQPVPPKPQNSLIADDTELVTATPKETQEPLFEEVDVIEEDAPASEANLDKIAQKLKQESQSTKKTVETEAPKKKVVTQQKKVHTAPKQTTKKAKKTVIAGHYYIQVGSFSKYEPNKKFLNSITGLGYHYKYHKVGKLNKVLVGPFRTREEANKAKKVLRTKVEPGAFVVKL
ncbi:MAG: SPOR domain-containing protein [Sulfurimonas sp.]|jgi:DedD protein